MVFCSQVHCACFLVDTLQKEAQDVVGGNLDQMKGTWSAQKTVDSFCEEFCAQADIAVTKTDVVVCTSVVGAGFSIACHFHGFHAFLFNILPFAEEQQFVRRLRFHIDSLPPDAKRDSVHASKRGMGCPLTSDLCVTISRDCGMLHCLGATKTVTCACL